jgi:hypothetical protein
MEYFWDFLRPFTVMAAELDPYIKIIVFLLVLGLFFISYLAYRKNKSKRLLFVSVAFALFAFKWLIKLVDIFISPGIFLADSSENIFELLILLSLFIALFRG